VNGYLGFQIIFFRDGIYQEYTDNKIGILDDRKWLFIVITSIGLPI
jgi:hypothetical protein